MPSTYTHRHSRVQSKPDETYPYHFLDKRAAKKRSAMYYLVEVHARQQMNETKPG